MALYMFLVFLVILIDIFSTFMKVKNLNIIVDTRVKINIMFKQPNL